MRTRPTSLYLHVPFCRHKCNYCDFVVRVLHQPQQIQRYIQQVQHEMASFRSYQVPFSTVYFGGGTPSLLPITALAQLRQSFALAPDYEWTVEANPETVTLERAVAWFQLGINRISLGVQSFDHRLLEACGRTHSPDHILVAYNVLQEAGFTNIGLDLIYGLPSETMQSWQHTLQQALQLKPQHLSLYALQIEDATVFGYRDRKNKLYVPEEEQVCRFYEVALQELASAGYRHYEISNWAWPGYESRHNQVYWRCQPCWGVGVGAHGYWNNSRYANPESLRDYYALDDRNPWRWQTAPEQPSHEAMVDFMIMGLRLLDEGVSPQRFYHRFGGSLASVFGATIDELLRQEWLQNEQDALRLSPEAILISNEVFERFLLSRNQ